MQSQWKCDSGAAAATGIFVKDFFMLIIIVPAFNEEHNIAYLLKKTHDTLSKENIPYKLILVNDGSTDRTENIVKAFLNSMPIVLISYSQNKGVGKAFHAGFKKALEICKEDDLIVTKEADNTSDLSILKNLILKIQQGNDLALASCYSKEGAVLNTKLHRWLMSKCANGILRFFFPYKGIRTYSSFYRAYNVKILRQLVHEYGDAFIESCGFESMVELLVKIIRLEGVRISEVPMILDGGKRIDHSKMKVFKTTLGILKVVFKHSILRNFKKPYFHFKESGAD